MENPANSGQELEKRIKAVENYKNHFRQMKTRLKTFASSNWINNDENLNMNLINMESTAKDKAKQGLPGVLSEKIKPCLQPCVLQPISIQGNARPENKLLVQSECMNEKAQRLESSRRGKENISHLNTKNNRSPTKGNLSKQQNFTPELGGGEKTPQISAPPLISFRGPAPEDLCQKGNQVAFQSKLCMSVSRNIDLDCMDQTGVLKSPKHLLTLFGSSICSPKEEGVPSKAVKSKKLIAIDLTSELGGSGSSEIKKSTFPENNFSRKGKNNTDDLTLEDFEDRLEAIKSEALTASNQEDCIGCQEFISIEKMCSVNPETSIKISSNAQEVSSAEISKLELSRKKGFKSKGRSPQVKDVKRPVSTIKPSGRFADISIHKRKSSLQSVAKNQMPCFRKSTTKAKPTRIEANSEETSQNQDTPYFVRSSFETRKPSGSYFFRNQYKSRELSSQIKSFALHSSRRDSQELTGRSLAGKRSNINSKRSSPLKLAGSSSKTGLESVGQSPQQSSRLQLIRRLAKGEKPSIDRDSMLRLTRKNYSNLPEVKSREKSRKAKEELREKSQRIKEYDLVGKIHIRRLGLE